MSDNMPFIELDECITYINNIITEKPKRKKSLLPDKDHDTVLARLMSQFQNPNTDDEYKVFRILIGLTQDELNTLYYKNNLYEFIRIDYMKDLVYTIFKRTKEFKNPEKLPKESKDLIELFWELCKEHVFHNYFAFNRIQRLKRDKRKCVVTIDTDSKQNWGL